MLPCVLACEPCVLACEPCTQAQATFVQANARAHRDVRADSVDDGKGRRIGATTSWLLQTVT
jgi:hypothetical protein